MGRSRSSSSESRESSRKSKKSKKNNRRRSRSRSTSRRSSPSTSRRRRSRSKSSSRRSSPSRRNRSRSRDKSSRKKSRRSRSRSRSKKSSRRRSRDRHRRERSSRSSSSSSSRSHRRRSKSSEKLTSSDRGTILERPIENLEPSKNVEINFVEKLQLAKAAHDIDTSSGFEPQTFISSASQKKYQQELERSKNPGIEASARDTFQFGTSIEKASAFVAKINDEGLCHPHLYADPKKREEKFIKYLFELRRKLKSP